MRFILILALLVTLFVFQSSADEGVKPFQHGFETSNWYQSWGMDEAPRNTRVVERDEALTFEAFRGKALKIAVEQGGHYGTSFGFEFKEQWGEEPEEIYFRYYLRFAEDWDPQRGGKLPGIAGTYGRAGWGGRPVHGDDGWSARGLFRGLVDGKTPIGFYSYHMDMKGQYGSSWVWEIDDLGYLQKNRWYCIEQYVKLNDPAESNGILRGWVDDQLAFERTGMRFRSVDDLKIENVWINVYHGGKWSAETEDHLFIDEVVISPEKIGMVD